MGSKEYNVGLKNFSEFFLELFCKFLGIIFRHKKPSYSPLGSREALKNVDKASPGLFIVVGGVGVVRGVLPFEIFLCENVVYFFPFFFNHLSY